MGKSTGIRLAVIRAVGRNGDHLGSCEICGKEAHSQHFANRNTVFRTDAGVAYLAAASGGAYGHRECLEQAFEQPLDASDWPRMRNLRVVPEFVMANISN